MKQILIILILSVTFSCCSSRSERLLEQAIELDSLGKYKEAIDVYNELLRLDSSNTSILISRAYDKGRVGDRIGEVEDLQTVLKVSPNNTLALFELGIIYGDLGRYEESIKSFNKAVASKGGEYVSMDFVKNDFFDDGSYFFDVPIADIKLERGIVYYKSDSIRKAYFDLTYCIDKGHNLKDSYYYRSRTYLKSGMPEHACEDARMSALYGMKEAFEITELSCE